VEFSQKFFPQKFFHGAIENTFHTEIGIANPEVIDYISEIVATFVHVDSIYPFHNELGGKLENFETAIQEFKTYGSSVYTRLLFKHIGDFTIFWTGLFPENIKRLHVGINNDVRSFIKQGKKSYLIASELSQPDDNPPGRVLKEIGQCFEECTLGLNLCRKEWNYRNNTIKEV